VCGGTHGTRLRRPLVPAPSLGGVLRCCVARVRRARYVDAGAHVPAHAHGQRMSHAVIIIMSHVAHRPDRPSSIMSMSLVACFAL
jgi:hypothetical protein